jgi:hypothetical protein
MIASEKNSDRSTKEALLNELKGNLFEYLVGLNLAKSFAIKDRFLRSLASDYLLKLKDYDAALRGLDLELYKILPSYAEQAAHTIHSFFRNSKIERVELVGKLSGSTHSQKEGDLLIIDSQNVEFYLSLKLYKKGAFVNTKSAGLRSFVKKYFSSFTSAEQIQKDLSHKFDFEHQAMIQALNAKAGFAQTSGELHPLWRDRGLSLLPGKLPPDLSIILYNCYHNMSCILYECLTQFLAEDQEKFVCSIKPLLGFSSENVLQVLTYYQSSREKRYGDVEVYVHRASEFQGRDLKMQKQSEQLSSFNINLDRALLQIRVKPMSSFVAASFKINCALKFS